MRAIFLIIDYVPHQVISIRTLMEKENADVLAFHVGRYKKEIPELGSKFKTFQYKSISFLAMLDLIRNFNADVIITAGWMIPDYNRICKKLKKESNIPIIALSDTPWYGTFRQKVNAFLSPYYLKKMFSHLWVAGIRQYDYARKLGFTNKQIIFGSLTANNEIFRQVNIDMKNIKYPKNFLFLGSLIELKGLRNLTKAWQSIEDTKGWTFTLVGSGALKNELAQSKEFIIKDHLQQTDLIAEMQTAGCFVLPSLHEQWAIVLHEAAVAGLPIICTETCGAAPHFVINGYNGFKIADNSVQDLKLKLQAITEKTDEELLRMSFNSRKLGENLSPELHLANLLQVIDERKEK